MKNEKKKDYFVGLDIGTNSIGYAATDLQYKLCKFKQHPVWGVHLFDSAQTSAERRGFRTARRRLDRRQQRVQLLRELFAVEIARRDKDFFRRIDASAMVKDDKDRSPYAIFADPNYTDRDFYRKYPTIHHLICDLMGENPPDDIRLLYLACAWLVVHRGHFLSDVNIDNLQDILNIEQLYEEMHEALIENGNDFPWKTPDMRNFGDALKAKLGKSKKAELVAEILSVDETKKDFFPYDIKDFRRLLCGSENIALRRLTGNEEYADDLKISLADDDEKIAETMSQLTDEDAKIIRIAKKMFDWSVLADIMGEKPRFPRRKLRFTKNTRQICAI